MKLNKKGNLGIAIVTTVMVFIVGFVVLNLLMPEVTQFRSDMSCASPADISDATKLLCLAVDTTIPYWILLILSISVGGIVAKLTL